MDVHEGSVARYRRGCHCDACKKAQSAYNRKLRIGLCKDCGKEAWTLDKWSQGRCKSCENKRRAK